MYSGRFKYFRSGINVMTDISGIFNGNDDGEYWVRQSGNNVYWFGKEKNNPPGFSNVFIGTIAGDSFSGKWGDVPVGGTRNEGTINLHIDGSDHFTRISETGGFSGSDWRRRH
jgi:hypothetical protein